ncbi:hypothetical protein HMPREF0043_01179 [Actinobaculum sp. oral taxon 183 str. F0552]|nr:hypothetical protein HMPREF0043_01179 [Actinobaculum sp. oral taxon 183 str. F0552]RKV69592.1 MAG: hypothetical protein D8B44_00160 [Actinomyces sp.]
MFGVGDVVRPVRCLARAQTVQLPVEYSVKASLMSGARSGSSPTVRISWPWASRARTLRQPRGALTLAPPFLAFSLMPSMTSLARFRL